VESEGGEEREEQEAESAGQEMRVGLKCRRRSGAVGGGEGEKLAVQEEEEGLIDDCF